MTDFKEVNTKVRQSKGSAASRINSNIIITFYFQALTWCLLKSFPQQFSIPVPCIQMLVTCPFSYSYIPIFLWP